MYETPELTLVGDASDTILGVVTGGDDIDGTYVWMPNQMATESLIDE